MIIAYLLELDIRRACHYTWRTGDRKGHPLAEMVVKGRATTRAIPAPPPPRSPLPYHGRVRAKRVRCGGEASYRRGGGGAEVVWGPLWSPVGKLLHGAGPLWSPVGKLLHGVGTLVVARLYTNSENKMGVSRVIAQ